RLNASPIPPGPRSSPILQESFNTLVWAPGSSKAYRRYLWRLADVPWQETWRYVCDSLYRSALTSQSCG
ncbi:unnamed protein product, partial [Mycena citricolor]